MAKKGQHIDDQIKASFDQASPKPPRDLWSDLSSSLDDDSLDQDLKKAFEGTNLKAPQNVWTRLNQQLTIDRAWNRIRRRLNYASALFWIRRVALIVLPLALLWFLYPNSEEYHIPEANGDAAKQEIAKPQALETENNQGPASKNPKETGSSTSTETKNRPAKGIASDDQGNLAASPALINKETPTVEGAAAQEKEAQPQFKDQEPPPLLTQAQDSVYYALKNLEAKGLHSWLMGPWSAKLREQFILQPLGEKPVAYPKERKAWQIGIRLHYDRIGIYNTIYRLANDANSLVAGRSTYGLNYELYSSYAFNDRSSLEFGFSWDEQLSQSYNRFGEGQFLSEGYDFSFSLYSLVYQHRFNFEGKWIPSLELAAGPYFAELKKVSFKSDLGAEDLSSLYTNRYGAILRLGQSFNAGDFNFAYGIQGQFSINNFHQGNSRLPAAFNESSSSRLGFYLGMAYRF